MLLSISRRTLATVCAMLPVFSISIAVMPFSVEAAAPANVRVAPPRRLGNEVIPVRAKEAPGLTVNPSNPKHVVEIDLNVREQHCDFHTSFDGGKTWTGGHLRVPTDGYHNPPCYPLDISNRPPMYASVAFGTGNNVYVTFAADITNETGDIADDGTAAMVARSTDGGKTFRRAVAAIPAPAEKGSGFNRTSVAVIKGTPDKVFVFALSQTDNPDSSFPNTLGQVVAVSTDGGRTFGSVSFVSEEGETGVGQSGLAASGPDGTLYIPWRVGMFGSPTGNLRLGVSTDQGATWTRSTIGSIAGLKEPISTVVDQSNGTVYIAYQSTVLGDFDIFVIRSTDRGQTWSDPVRVNDDAENNKVAQITPGLSIGPSTRLNVTWYDQRDRYPNAGPSAGLAAAGPAEDVYYAYSLDGGQTFSENHRISDRTINRDQGVRVELGAHYPPRSVSIGGKRLLIAWTDSREGSVDTDNQDVYTARVNLNPSGDIPAVSVSHGNLNKLSARFAKWTWPGGAEDRSYERLTWVTIVNKSDFQGALPAGVLARAVGGPILFSSRFGLSDAVKKEIARMQPAGAFLIGNESKLSNAVGTEARKKGRFPSASVVRISGGNGAETAKLIAERTLAVPPPEPDPATTFSAAIVVNPDKASAAAASALAAQSPYPILFVGQNSIPQPTQEALDAYAITKTYVIGPEAHVGAGVASQLPGAERISGTGTQGTSAAVLAEGVNQLLPHNVVYVSEAGNRMLAALLGPIVARRSGVHVLVSHGKVSAARSLLAGMGMTAGTDRLVVGRIE